jgi:hypothetical protein
MKQAWQTYTGFTIIGNKNLAHQVVEMAHLHYRKMAETVVANFKSGWSALCHTQD